MINNGRQVQKNEPIMLLSGLRAPARQPAKKGGATSRRRAQHVEYLNAHHCVAQHHAIELITQLLTRFLADIADNPC